MGKGMHETASMSSCLLQRMPQICTNGALDEGRDWGTTSLPVLQQIGRLVASSGGIASFVGEALSFKGKISCMCCMWPEIMHCYRIHVRRDVLYGKVRAATNYEGAPPK